MAVAVLERIVEIMEYCFEMDPDFVCSFEFPRGKLEHEPARGGVAASTDYSCRSRGAAAGPRGISTS